MSVINEGQDERINANRLFMKCIYPEREEDIIVSDQRKQLPQPPLNNAAKGEIIKLVGDFGGLLTNEKYADLLDIRRSVRQYADKPLTQAQLGFLLWSAQGAQSIRGDNYAVMRPVPCGGARHAFELYFTVGEGGVEGLKAGVYHYLPLENVGSKDVTVEFLRGIDDYGKTVSDMAVEQAFAAKSPVTLFLSCVAYRAEWRYSVMAHRVMLIDLGHVGQNVMLSAAALGLGSCCLAAFDQNLCDETLGLDGADEFTVYVIPVGYAG